MTNATPYQHARQATRPRIPPARLTRRLAADPQVLLAVALALPTVLVNLVEHGPNQVQVAGLAAGFIVVQAVLSAGRWATNGLIPSALVTSHLAVTSDLVPGERASSNRLRVDLWAIMRLALAVGFVAVAAAATADQNEV
ncbi:MAG: hypothetical protein ACRDGQ_08980, partial [Candidatus Limnocylindrales bacterium]